GYKGNDHPSHVRTRAGGTQTRSDPQLWPRLAPAAFAGFHGGGSRAGSGVIRGSLKMTYENWPILICHFQTCVPELVLLARRARTQFTKVFEAVDTRAMAVAPFELERVLANQLDFSKFQSVGNVDRQNYSNSSHLVLA